MNYKDKGLNSFQSGYNSFEELTDICTSFWDSENISLETGLEGEVAFLLSHHFLLRGENIRLAELSDFYSVYLENEGSLGRTQAFYFRRDKGKTLSAGEIVHHGMLRSKDPRICGVRALAFYLFYRFQIKNEPLPDFSRSENWYDLKVIFKI